MSSEKFLLLGLGHPYRSDDGFGPRVIQALKEEYGDRFDYRLHAGDPADLLDVWDQRSLMIFDAMRCPHPQAGTLHQFQLQEDGILPGQSAVSSHALSLAEALELGRVLQKMPRECIILAVEGENFAAGEELSPAVAVALNQVLTLVPQLTKGV
jgi:hydrogenase maturation protease